MKPAVALATVHILSGLFQCDLCLFWLGFILVFTVPAVYMRKKDMIDQTYLKVSGQAEDAFGNVWAKVPKYSDLKED